MVNVFNDERHRCPATYTHYSNSIFIWFEFTRRLPKIVHCVSKSTHLNGSFVFCNHFKITRLAHHIIPEKNLQLNAEKDEEPE